MNVFGAIFILIIDIILAIVFGKLASKKGYPGIAWGIIGFFVPILYLILLLVPTINLQNVSKKELKENKNLEGKKLSKINIEDVIKIILAVFVIILFMIFIMLYINSDDDNQKNKIINTTKLTITTTTKTQIINAKKSYHCINGGQLQGSKCIFVSSLEPAVIYHCTEGIANYQTGQCEITRYDENYNPSKIYKPAQKELLCGNGDYKLEGEKCVYRYTVEAIVDFTCPEGYYLLGTKCRVIN